MPDIEASLPAPPQDEVPWEDLLAWAETDLRRQVARRLGPASPLTPSSVIGSTFRRAAGRPGRLPRQPDEARNWLFRVALNVLSEKRRNARAWRRCPRDAAILPMAEWSDCLAGPGADEDGGHDLLAELPEEFQDLLRFVYWDGGTLREYAHARGICERQASRRHRRALEQLRAAFERR